MNLIEALQAEITRNQKLIEIYKLLPVSVGLFAMTMITEDVRGAQHAIAHGDTVAMIRLLETLRGNDL